MAWTKPSQSLIDLFFECLPDDPRLQKRRMFGFDSVFVHGNMCAGLFQEDIFARLPPDYRAELEAEHGPIPFQPMPGRAMGGYALAPQDVVADEERLADFLRRAVDYTGQMPPKEAKPRKAPKAKAAKA